MKIKILILIICLFILILFHQFNFKLVYSDNNKSLNYLKYLKTYDSNNNKTKNVTNRLIIIADLHGDYEAFLTILNHSQLIDHHLNWLAYNTTLVQSGDIADRGAYALDIYHLLWKLQTQAITYNSEVIMLLGNHELMNMQSNYMSKTTDSNTYENNKIWSKYHIFGNRVRHNLLLTIQHNSLIIHGGIHPLLLQSIQTFTNLNNITQQLLLNNNFNSLLFDDDGPLWTRQMTEQSVENHCELVTQTLHFLNNRDHLNVSRIMVGHTIQQSGRIQSYCNNTFYPMDIGMSYAFNLGSPRAYVEIKTWKHHQTVYTHHIH